MHRTTTGLRSSRRRDVEVAATMLIRSVLEPDWSAAEAGAALRARVHGDRNVLLILRARAVRELSRGWTPLGQRAAATVDAALGTTSGDQGDHRDHRDGVVPSPRVAVAAGAAA